MSGMPERKTLSVTFSCPMCTEKADSIAELEAKNKQLVEIILSEVEYYQPNGEYMPETEAFYCDGVVYGLEKAAAIVKAALKEKDDA